eukprot:PITA_11333
MPYTFSAKTCPRQKRTTVTEKEFLAVVHSLNKFRHYITGYQKFVHTDHAAIRYLMNKPDVNARIIRWLLLLQQFDLTIVDKRGKQNVVADFLSRLDLPAGEEGTVDDQMPAEHLFAISVLSSWLADIANYLVLAQFPPHLSLKEKGKIMRKSTPFTWIRGNMFKLGPDQILRHCVREEEVFDILLTCHDGPCGSHFAAKRTAFKILQADYYWPTLHQDVRRYISQCDRCQRMGKPTPRDECLSQPQVNFEPFEKWGMDFVGPSTLLQKQSLTSLVCTDYLTKWAENKGNQKQRQKEKVEVTNRALEGILTKVVSSSRKDWADLLVEATWAYNTTWKTITSFTPYELVYGKKALLSIEFEYNILRVAAQLDLDLSHAQRERLLQLNGLDEHRMQALLHSEVVQLQRKIWHDSHLNEKQFQPGDWVLLYDSRYKDFKEKPRKRWLGPYTMEKCNENGSILIRTIDEEAIPMLVNGHRLKIYRKPLSRQEFIETMEKAVLVIEQGSASILATP